MPVKAVNTKKIGAHVSAGGGVDNAPLNSRVDRHAGIGKGALGLDPFGFIMNEPRFDSLPLILETPDEDLWAGEIRLLYAMARHHTKGNP